MFQLAFALLIAGVIAKPLLNNKRAFEGEQVVKCVIDSAEKHALIGKMEDDYELDVFKEYPNGNTDIRVNAAQFAMIRAAGISCELLIEDLASVIAEASARREKYTHSLDVYFEEYHTYDEQVAYYQSMCNQYSSICDYSVIGTSTLGNQQFEYVIQKNASKPVFFLDAGIHAREWISSTTLQYIFTQLLETNAQTNSLVNRYTWVIHGHQNPDGYEYSWLNDNNRLWRKSRNVNQGSNCIGTDLNRNWPTTSWGGAGSSANPCSDTYHGSGAGSEIETKNLISRFNYYVNNFDVPVAVSFHAYSQLILRPWGDTTRDSPDETGMRNLGTAMENAIRATTGYNYDNIKSIELYATTGTTGDWYYQSTLNNTLTTYGYTYELRDTGRYGFELPENQIIPQGQEIWAAMIAMADYTDANPRN